MVRWQVVTIIVICVLAAAGLFLSVSAPAVVVEEPAPVPVVVEEPVDDGPVINPYSFQVFMYAGGISPASITVPVGQKTTLVLKSSDGNPHRFVMRSFRVDEVVRPGQPVTVVLQPETVGAFSYQDFEAYDGKAPGTGILRVE